jgi:hypothetical protein
MRARRVYTERALLRGCPPSPPQKPAGAHGALSRSTFAGTLREASQHAPVSIGLSLPLPPPRGFAHTVLARRMINTSCFPWTGETGEISGSFASACPWLARLFLRCCRRCHRSYTCLLAVELWRCFCLAAPRTRPCGLPRWSFESAGRLFRAAAWAQLHPRSRTLLCTIELCLGMLWPARSARSIHWPPPIDARRTRTPPTGSSWLARPAEPSRAEPLCGLPGAS